MTRITGFRTLDIRVPTSASNEIVCAAIRVLAPRVVGLRRRKTR